MRAKEDTSVKLQRYENQYRECIHHDWGHFKTLEPHDLGRGTSMVK